MVTTIYHGLTKRPLLFFFVFMVLGIVLFYPKTYEPDPVFPQGLYYSVTVSGQIQTYRSQEEGISLTLTQCQILYNGQSYECSRLLVTTDDTAPTLQAGNRVTVTGSLSSFSPARNPGNFDWWSYYRSQHISYRVYADTIAITDAGTFPLRQALLSLRKTLTLRLQQFFGCDTETSGLLTALLLGDKTMLEEDTKQQYQDGGILHILTVSGLHVSLLGTAMVILGKNLRLPPLLQHLSASILILLYCQLCQGGVSSRRAAIMFVCLMAAPLLGRTYDSLSALSLAGIFILWDSPSMLFQAGFLLSFGAALGLQLVCPAFANVPSPPVNTKPSSPNPSTPPSPSPYEKPSFFQKMHSSLRFHLGLQFTLLPITLYHFFQYPLYSLILNLVILPLTGPLFLLGASGVLLGEFLPAGGELAASCLLTPCEWILDGYDMLCRITLSLPHATVLLGRPSLLRIMIYYILLGLYCLHRHGSKSLKSPLWMGILLLVLLLPLPSKTLSMTFLDVGQGDCTFIHCPSGTTILIDSGSNDVKQMARYRLIPFFKSRGIQHVDYVFLSHTDQDHMNGISDWLEEGGSIGTVILPALSQELSLSPTYVQAVSFFTSHQIPIYYFSQGSTWQEGDLTMKCLAPVEPASPQAILYETLNTASQVLLIEYQGIQILMTGDCEKEGESLLLHYLQENDITCHILKAGHHGSAYATSQSLLQQLQPQTVIISCGVRNRYGHPHPTMLSRVESSGAAPYVTASCGAISLKVHDGNVHLKTFLPLGPLYYR